MRTVNGPFGKRGRSLLPYCCALLAGIAPAILFGQGSQAVPVQGTPVVPAQGVTGVATRPTSPRLVTPLLPAICSDIQLYSASVIRNNKPVANSYSAPTYYGSISRSGPTWTVKVPAEAYDLQTPYLVRFTFRVPQQTNEEPPYEFLEAFHPALTVLTKQQAEDLDYIAGVSGSLGNWCFLKVTVPNGYQLGSMPGPGGITFRDVTDDWPAAVTVNGQYGLQIWYFLPSGVFTKVGDFAIRMESCPARSGDRYRCQ